MTNFKGTKAKWFVEQDSYSNGWIAITSDFDSDYDKMVCTIYGPLTNVLGVLPEKTLANALLISKAPEMLEMLESIVSTWDTNQNFDEEYFNNIKNLIKQATEL